MVEQLFGSKTRVKLLQLFLGNPNRQFYVREITRKIDEQINSVRRELSNLLSIGIIVSDSNNNKLYYEVNQKYKFYAPLRQIFGKGYSPIQKEEEALKLGTNEVEIQLNSVGHIELAILTGQFTRDESSGIDLLIVGDVNPNALVKYVNNLEQKENKVIRYTIMKMEDFKYRIAIKDRFALSVLGSKKQVLVDMHGIVAVETKQEEEQ
jgi:hypothetical protein